VSTKPRRRPDGPLWSHCNVCGHDTLHKVVKLVSESRDFEYDRYTVTVGSNWRILQCSGCQEVAMSRTDWCSEDDPQDPSIPTFFPPRISRRKPAWVDRLEVPSEYIGIFDEVYAALHADSRRLAMMGARALIDAVIRRTVGDQDNFARGLDELSAKYLISERDRGIIEAAIDAGHASAHRGHKPTSDDVNVVIDIVERMIHAEILAEQAQALKKRTPQRKQSVKRKK
jgi:hypothetical protein